MSQLPDLIDTQANVGSLADTLLDLPTHPPSLYMDLEGVKLSRHGSVSILQIYVLPVNRTYLVDIHTLQNAAFTTMGTRGHSLKTILESATIPKVFFDIRNDSDALYTHFNIHVAGIVDLQLMELATRTGWKKRVSGLAKCIERGEASMSSVEKQRWAANKEVGMKLFDPERGGSYEVFNVRPLPENIKQYCMQDVQFLPRLWQCYHSKLTPLWREKVERETKARIRLSQSASYVSHGPHKALGPW
jgi:exonuclease 3'-5' domain-containing protein 1